MQPPTFKGQSILLCKVAEFGRLHNFRADANLIFLTQRNAEVDAKGRKVFGLTID